MKTQTIILWIIVLVIIDQTIKIIIYNFFFDINFDIIPSLFEFVPKFNDRYSYLNDSLVRAFNVDLGLIFHLLLFCLLVSIYVILYDFFNSIKPSKLLDSAIIFGVSGLCCSLIGMLIWEKGTLDYIYLKPYFIFDLKDVYLNCFAPLLLIYIFRNKLGAKEVSLNQLVIHIKKRLARNSSVL